MNKYGDSGVRLREALRRAGLSVMERVAPVHLSRSASRWSIYPFHYEYSSGSLG